MQLAVWIFVEVALLLIGLTKGVGPSTTLAWPGWKQPDIPVEVDMARLETSRTDTVKDLPAWLFCTIEIQYTRVTPDREN
jgi:hypothetical protein